MQFFNFTLKEETRGELFKVVKLRWEYTLSFYFMFRLCMYTNTYTGHVICIGCS